MKLAACRFSISAPRLQPFKSHLARTPTIPLDTPGALMFDRFCIQARPTWPAENKDKRSIGVLKKILKPFCHPVKEY